MNMQVSLLFLALTVKVAFTSITPLDDVASLLKRIVGTEKRALKPLPSTCTPAYQALPLSTMCDYNSSPKATNKGVSTAAQKIIVDLHNSLRSKVATDTHVTASDMQQMIWDENLAVLAQKWTEVCIPGHDQNKQRLVPGWGISVGQNWADGDSDWSGAINDWYNEVDSFNYGNGNKISSVGHFTQMTLAKSARVGCGYAKCSGTPTYVCNYAFEQMGVNTPYNRGASCGACQGHCSNNLCDCNGLICMNGGTINLNTCSCSCPPRYSGSTCLTQLCPNIKCQNGGTVKLSDCSCSCPAPYSGPKCNKKSCSPDPSYCGQAQPHGYPKSFCPLYTNVPQECPVMCGICP